MRCTRLRVRTFLRQLLLVGCGLLFTANAPAVENSLKAAFLYKFASYVTWPESAFPAPDTPITIAVMGADAVVENLRSMVLGRSAQGRPIAVRRVTPGESLADVHIVFVGQSLKNNFGRIAQTTGTLPILFVTDFEVTGTSGSAIHFVRTGDRLRFEIHLEYAEQRGLLLSSRLLDVALRVETGGR